tara:strand:- start:224 stop:1702 length:1479 start_codon:yes stop_codon:yes gene_type:complete
MNNIIARQSIYNSLSIFFAFFLGAINTLFLYPSILTEQFYGLITALLAFSNIIQPILSFGVQHTIIKFYSNCKDKMEQNSLLIYSVVFPFILILFFSIFFNLKYDLISNYLSSKNSLIKKYIFFIILISISTSYFEVFYSWLKIKRKTIFGNFMKEVYPRLLTFTLLILYFFLLIDINEFIIYFIVGYYLRLVIIIIKASFNHSLSLSKISFSRDWFVYSGYIFLSAFAASILIDIDKSMISQFLTIENVAYYSIGAFIAALVDIPSRGLFQIINPMVSEVLSKNNLQRLKNLLEKSALNLFLVSGLIFLLINLNISDLYKIIEKLYNTDSYSVGIPIVLIISISKLISSTTGCINSIITNSKYYYYILFFSFGSAIVVFILNIYFISFYGIIGAAISTLIVLTVFNFLKLILVYNKFKIHPFNKNFLKILLLIVSIYFITSFINFNMNPYFQITLRSILILFVYLYFLFYFNLSEDIKKLMIDLKKKSGLF